MSEEQAFDMLKFLMYDLGIRRQYRPDMVSLQVSGPNLAVALVCFYGIVRSNVSMLTEVSY